MNRIFRTTIIVSTLLYLAFYALPYFDYLWLTQGEVDFLSNKGAGSTIPAEPYIWHAFFTLWLVIAFGLFFYKNLARKAFIFMILFTTILIPFSGYSVLTPLETVLISLVEMMDGALLVMMFFTSVSNEFAKAHRKSFNQAGANNASSS